MADSIERARLKARLTELEAEQEQVLLALRITSQRDKAKRLAKLHQMATEV